MIKPMLAHKLNENKIDWDKPVYMQPKLDGVRCLFTKDGAFSRTGKQFMNVRHIEDSLREYFKQYPDIILDGELYNHDLRDDFEKIISLVRKQKPGTIERYEAAKMIQYHIYDWISSSANWILTGGLSYKERLDNLICADIYCGNVKHVKTNKVRFYDEAKAFHNLNLKRGFEGSILRTDTPYKHGRSWGLMKFKDFHDAEATIVDYQEGKGKRLGTIGKFIMQDDDGNIFGCPPGKGYNYSDLRCILENIHKYMGQQATFTYFERTKAGSYRHPLFKTLRNYE
jgi:DNA ligase-1